MTVRDQNRLRKTYSFFRATPTPLPVTREPDVLIFPNISALSTYDAAGLESGRLAFVKSVKDYFFIEKTINSGSNDSIQKVAASGLNGVWHRLGLGGGYWKNQTNWYIDSEVGHDENLGAVDSPLKTLDELVRRLFGVEKIRSNYLVTFTSVTQSISNTFGLDVELDGGRIILNGAPKFSASLGTVSAASGAIDYAAATVPWISFTGTGSIDNNLLYVSASGAGYDVVGWALSGSAGTVYTTPFALTGSAGKQLYQASLPTINTPGIIARGRGQLIVSGVVVGIPGNNGLVIGSTNDASLSFVLSSIESTLPETAGGVIEFDRSRIRSTLANVLIHNSTNVYATGSGLVTPHQNIDVRDSHVECGSTAFWNSLLLSRKSQIIMSVPLASGCGLASSSIEAQSDSLIDVKNMVATHSNGIPNPLKVTGQNVTVFFDDAAQPKANMVAINNGVVQLLSWSQVPYQDLLRDVRIVSGSLANIL